MAYGELNHMKMNTTENENLNQNLLINSYSSQIKGGHSIDTRHIRKI